MNLTAFHIHLLFLYSLHHFLVFSCTSNIGCRVPTRHYRPNDRYCWLPGHSLTAIPIVHRQIPFLQLQRPSRLNYIPRLPGSYGVSMGPNLERTAKVKCAMWLLEKVSLTGAPDQKAPRVPTVKWIKPKLLSSVSKGLHYLVHTYIASWHLSIPLHSTRKQVYDFPPLSGPYNVPNILLSTLHIQYSLAPCNLCGVITSSTKGNRARHTCKFLPMKLHAFQPLFLMYPMSDILDTGPLHLPVCSSLCPVPLGHSPGLSLISHFTGDVSSHSAAKSHKQWCSPLK